MRALVVAALFAAGCVGPLLPIPPERPGAHAYYCERVVCPGAAYKVGGILQEWAYSRDEHACTCYVTDSRNLPQFITIPIHRH